MTRKLDNRRTRYASVLVALACCVFSPLRLSAKEHTLLNPSNEDKTWSGQCTVGGSGNGLCNLTGTVNIASCTVSKNSSVILGGSKGGCLTKNCWFTSCTEGKWTCPTSGKETSMHVELGDMSQPTDTTVVFPIWSAVDPAATVAIYQSFIAPIRPQLIANAEFEVVGHDADGDPILIHKETGVPMTDEDGNLFPEFVFNGELYPAGYVTAPQEDPEPVQPNSRGTRPNSGRR